MGFFESGGAAAKFTNPGDTVSGTLTRPYRESQAMKFGTNTPDTWPDGSPKMQAIIDLQTAQRDPEKADDDGVRTLYVTSTKMKRAIADAIKKAGVPDLQPGGTLTVTFTGYDPQSKNPAQPAKLYTAAYQAPTGSLAPQQSSWDGQQPAPTLAPAAAPAAAPAPAAGPQVDEEKVRKLIALSLTDEQIQSAMGAPFDAIQRIRATSVAA